MESEIDGKLTYLGFEILRAERKKILLELGQRKHTRFYIACRLYWNSTVKSHFSFFFLNTIFNTFSFLYKFESLGFQMQATDKGGRVGDRTHTVKQAK